MKRIYSLFILFSCMSLPLAAQTETEVESVVLEQNQELIQVQEETQGRDSVQVRERKSVSDFFNKLFKRPTSKQVRQENEILRTELDSLQMLVDSLRVRAYVDEQEIEALEQEENLQVLEYSPEAQDSLLHLWYKNTLTTTDFDTVNEYDMDSVRFSSNVSDAEMMRRLSAMNSFITLPYNDVVKNYIILYSERMPSKMGRVLGLSNYYFPIFEDILLRYGLPQELKYMAIIESMLNPVATSRAGARGIWQFMYQTGVGYGLEINSFVDERLDVEKAVEAAARYLRDAYRTFGDWALAISSYNCGAGNVSKAIRRANGNRDFWSIYTYLPRETRGYVPAFVAAMYAMTYYREYGIVPQQMGMPAQTDTFMIRRNLHFDQIEAVVGVPKEELQNLNPQYVNDIIPGNSHPYVLKLPYTWTSRFLEADRDSLYAFKADSLLSGKVLQDRGRSRSSRTSSGRSGTSGQQRIAYKVRSGDYLGKIASRYGVSITQIKNWNNLRSNKIQIGQTLYIYKNGGPTISQGGSSKSSGSTSKATIYTVKSGDSLYKIAKRYPGISAENIKAANGLKSDAIRAGQKLTIPAR
ncbi:MAG: LysM peptidoglycan-binding domain-containing protein [Bacteroidales bacterium]|nr:LysM peptidoglycan-binding domain-containing protein [Bacteroidales bacterium]